MFNSVVEWNSFQECCCTQPAEKPDAVRATSLWLKCKSNRCASSAFHRVCRPDISHELSALQALQKQARRKAQKRLDCFAAHCCLCSIVCNHRKNSPDVPCLQSSCLFCVSGSHLALDAEHLRTRQKRQKLFPLLWVRKSCRFFCQVIGASVTVVSCSFIQQQHEEDLQTRMEALPSKALKLLRRCRSKGFEAFTLKVRSFWSLPNKESFEASLKPGIKPLRLRVQNLRCSIPSNFEACSRRKNPSPSRLPLKTPSFAEVSQARLPLCFFAFSSLQKRFCVLLYADKLSETP